MAASLNWPLVRAEKAQVGSYSLSGLIQDAFGFASTYIQQVALGETGLIVDSMDEAHFRAGTDNFLAFLDNVQKVAGASALGQTRAPSIVLLSRSDTAEMIRLSFADAGVPLAHAMLDFFDLSGAERFISAYMAQRYRETKRSEYNLPLSSPGPFERLRNDRMRQIAGVLMSTGEADLRRDWPRLTDFLGYTPVLIALAESLSVANPSAERRALTARDQSDLLREIIEHIARREQRKFSEHLRPRLQATLPASSDRDVVAASMYTPREQCARLLAYVSGSDLASALPGSLPQEVRASYEEAVSTFLPDHPFIKGRRFASVVFGDHVASVACQSLDVRAALPWAPEAVVEDVGPFFARFMAEHAGGGAATCEVREPLIEQVISSWTQETDLVKSADSEVLVSMHGEDATLLCVREAGPGLDPVELEFSITEMTGAWHIKRPVKRLTVTTDQGVILGSSGQHLLIGPRVVLLADEVVIEAEALRVDAEGGRSLGAAIAAETCLANYLTKVESGPKDLRVYVEDPPARLRPYAAKLSLHMQGVPFQRYLDLRTILTAFRPSTKGGLSVLAAKIDNKIVKDNPYRLRILDHLIETSAVSRQGQHYYLDLNELGQHGFGLHDLKTGEPSRALLTFLQACQDDSTA